MRNYSILFITFLLFYFINGYGCSAETGDLTAEKQATVQDKLTINEASSDSPLFAFVHKAASDSQENVYLVDPSTQKIHSYRSDGSYRLSIGGEGQGPGEFQFVSSIYIDDDDRIIVYDSDRAFLTIFDTDGEILDNRSFEFGRKTIENLRSTHQNLLLPYWDEGKLIHLYSLESAEIQASLVNFEEMLQTQNELEEELFKSFPGSAISINEGLIAYVPAHYAGMIYLFEERSDKVWENKGTIEGYKQFDPSISFHVTEDGIHTRSHSSGYNPRGGGTYAHYEFHSWSFGLYPQDDGSVVHLSYQAVEDEMHLVVEIFDIESNQLQSYTVIDDLEIAFRPEKYPVWVNKKGNIFLADNSNLPELRVLRLEYE